MSPALNLFRNYAIALAVVAILIWIPFTGFILTILTFGLLPALIVNALLIHLAIVAVHGEIDRKWLVVPLSCYGVWAGWCAWENAAAYQTKRRLEAENHLDVAVDQGTALVFPSNDSAENNNLAIRAKRRLAGQWRVFAGAIELGPIGRDQILCNLWTRVESNRCPTEAPSAPTAESLVFRRMNKPDPRRGMFLERYEITRSASPDGQLVGHFNFGLIKPPLPLPIVMAGCGILDRPSGWSCFFAPVTWVVKVGETGADDRYDYLHEYSDPVIATLAAMLGGGVSDESLP